VNLLHWLDHLLPQLPRYGFALIFIFVFLSNIVFPFPGKVTLFGAGFVWGRAAGSLGTDVGRDIGKLLRRYLCILARPALGSLPPREASLVASDADAFRVASAILQTSLRQDCVSRTLVAQASKMKGKLGVVC